MSIDPELAELRQALATARQQTADLAEVLEAHKRRTGLQLHDLENERDKLKAQVAALEEMAVSLRKKLLAS